MFPPASVYAKLLLPLYEISAFAAVQKRPAESAEIRYAIFFILNPCIDLFLTCPNLLIFVVFFIKKAEKREKKYKCCNIATL